MSVDYIIIIYLDAMWMSVVNLICACLLWHGHGLLCLCKLHHGADSCRFAWVHVRVLIINVFVCIACLSICVCGCVLFVFLLNIPVTFFILFNIIFNSYTCTYYINMTTKFFLYTFCTRYYSTPTGGAFTILVLPLL